MIKEKLGIDIEGRVAFHKEGQSTIYKNAIQDTAKTIIALLLQDNITGKITAIELYNGGILIATGLITNKALVGLNTVEFDATFDNASFNSHVDEARLQSAGSGYFSIVTGLDEIKDNTQSIMVSWTIQIINCA